MSNLWDTIFLYGGECIARFSYLHECTFKLLCYSKYLFDLNIRINMCIFNFYSYRLLTGKPRELVTDLWSTKYDTQKIAQARTHFSYLFSLLVIYTYKINDYSSTL